MSVYIDPSRANFDAFKALPRDEPIYMLNLVRFHDHAIYPEQHPCHGAQWSGRQAYAEYGRRCGPIFQRVGASVVWRGMFETMVTGPEGEHWDEAFTAHYPSANAFFAMLKDDAYGDAVAHRTAATKDSRLIRLSPQAPGELFAM